MKYYLITSKVPLVHVLGESATSATRNAIVIAETRNAGGPYRRFSIIAARPLLAAREEKTRRRKRGAVLAHFAQRSHLYASPRRISAAHPARRLVRATRHALRCSLFIIRNCPLLTAPTDPKYHLRADLRGPVPAA